jgi:hypothetical protein
VEGIDPVVTAIIALVATLFGIVVREGTQLILKLAGKTNGGNPGNGKYVRKDVCDERRKLTETRLDKIDQTTMQTQSDVRMLTQHLLEND